MSPRFRQFLLLSLLAPLLASAQDGTLKWRSFLANPLYSSPALSTSASSGYLIYIGSQGTIATASRLYRVNASGGSVTQYAGVTDWVDSTPAVGADGAIYFGSWDSKIVALTSGFSLRWALTTSGFVASSAALGSDGTIYIGSGDRNLYALNPDGTTKWTYPVADWIDSSPAVGPEDTIYFGSYDDNVYALRSNGTLRWQFATGNSVTSSPAIGADATVYIGSNDSKLYALNGATGALNWSYTTGGAIAASPVVGADGTIYVGSLDGYLYAINSNGTLRWRFNAGSEIYASAALRADGTIFFGANFHLYALNSDGSQRWRYTTGDYVDSSPVIAGDGTIVVGSNDRYLYAINGNGQGPATNAPWPQHRQNSQRTGRSPVTAFPATSAAPSVTLHPVSQTIAAGGSVTLTVGAAGTAPLSYEWFKNDNAIAGATAASYSINSVQSTDAASYTVRVSNASGAVFSNAAILTVTTPSSPPVVTVAPVSQTVFVGHAVTLSVSASGTSPFGYLWFKDGVPIADSNSASYSLAAATFADAGTYTVLIANSVGSTTASATLAVTTASQSLNFDAPGDRRFSFSPVTLSATATSGLAPSFTLVSGPATLAGNALTLTGLGTVTVRADQAGSSTYSAAPSVTRSFTVSSSYDYWLLQNFTALEITAGTLTAPAASPATDGVPNLVKYALGLAPKTAATAALGVPTATESAWNFTYTRPSGQTDVIVSVEFSSDLAAWTSESSALAGSSNGTDTWTATVPRTAGANAFFRLKVLRP